MLSCTSLFFYKKLASKFDASFLYKILDCVSPALGLVLAKQLACIALYYRHTLTLVLSLGPD